MLDPDVRLIAEPLLVPSWMVGRPNAVYSAMRRQVKKAVRARSWQAAVDGFSMVDLRDIEGGIVRTRHTTFLKGEHAVVEPFTNNLHDAICAVHPDPIDCQDRQRWLELERDRFFLSREMALGAGDQFWTALCLMNSTGLLPIRFPYGNPHLAEIERLPKETNFPRESLGKLMPWWETFGKLGSLYQKGMFILNRWDQFTRYQWALWQARSLQYQGWTNKEIGELGTIFKKMSDADVAQWLRNWCAGSGDDNPRELILTLLENKAYR